MDAFARLTQNPRMTKRFTVELDERSKKFVETQIADGRFKTAADVVRAGLQLLKKSGAPLNITKPVKRKRRQIARNLIRRKLAP